MEQIVSPVAEVTRCGEHSTSQLSHSSSCHFRCAGEAKSEVSGVAVFFWDKDGCTNSSRTCTTMVFSWCSLGILGDYNLIEYPRAIGLI